MSAETNEARKTQAKVALAKILDEMTSTDFTGCKTVEIHGHARQIKEVITTEKRHHAMPAAQTRG